MLDLSWPLQRHELKSPSEVSLRQLPISPIRMQAAPTDVVGEDAAALLREPLSRLAFDSIPDRRYVRRHGSILKHGPRSRKVHL
jgi:hypothetical protein